MYGLPSRSMKKVIKGIIEFRKKITNKDRETLAQLALGQSPDAFFLACSDSRVAPNVFASNDPGDLFVSRNPGNIFPPCGKGGFSVGDQSEVAALEFALHKLNVKDIIVCGHSECGAMHASYNGREKVTAPHLKSWLEHTDSALEELKKGHTIAPDLEPHNQLSQLNVLQQLEHLKTYPLVAERMEAGNLSVHGWWFDIGNAEVYGYKNDLNKFVLIDESWVK